MRHYIDRQGSWAYGKPYRGMPWYLRWSPVFVTALVAARLIYQASAYNDLEYPVAPAASPYAIPSAGAPARPPVPAKHHAPDPKPAPAPDPKPAPSAGAPLPEDPSWCWMTRARELEEDPPGERLVMPAEGTSMADTLAERIVVYQGNMPSVTLEDLTHRRVCP